MFLKWLPWKYMVRRVARAHGFLDPILIMSRLGNFAQPSEVGEPIELLRAGLVFHARGLMNTRAIQNNLDWIWPYWVERQFNPHDVSFIPRAFSISHVNLSHRNWTAVGMPDAPFLPIVDPSGLVTPFYDGWSLDAWILQPMGKDLIPSKSLAFTQTWDLEPEGLAVRTHLGGLGRSLDRRAEVAPEGPGGALKLRIRAKSDREAFLAVSLRPYNPEGVSFIHDVKLEADRKHWTVNGAAAVTFSDAVEQHYSSEYHHGDVYRRLSTPSVSEDMGSRCRVGLTTAAALFRIPNGATREITLKVDLEKDKETKAQFPRRRPPSAWAPALADTAKFQVPDAKYRFLYDAAIRSLLLHSPGEVFPGPYTYKRFWFRDAAFVLDAMLLAGMEERVVRTLDLFPAKQTMGGYYLSQEGEWDSNGEALWTILRYCEATGTKPKEGWLASISKGGEWIERKRLRSKAVDGVHERVLGLLPAGFSAEHLGPNDYYYWDDFWGVAGLEAAATLLEMVGSPQYSKSVEAFRRYALDFRAAIDKSIAGAQAFLGNEPGVPASPFRRMDSGSIGNLAASYPLGIWPENDPRMAATLNFLVEKCLFKGAFFQDMIHSGINAYLTLHMAQGLLRAGDIRGLELIQATAEVASSTGQWPEAIHPHTMGGCMGDGQHVWAAAEWVLMMRNLFLREEGNRLVIASGISEEWQRTGEVMSFGPGPCRFGRLTVRIDPVEGGCRVRWSGKWHRQPEAVEVRLPGRKAVILRGITDGEAMIPDEGISLAPQRAQDKTVPTHP